MTEEQLQAKSFQNIWNKYPETRGLIRLVLNNPKNKIHGAQCKAMGLIPGTSDHMMIIPNGMVWLECKLDDGKQSKSQKEFQSLCEQTQGHYYYVYRSVEDFENIVLHHLKKIIA
jgi:hypothetical protein